MRKITFCLYIFSLSISSSLYCADNITKAQLDEAIQKYINSHRSSKQKNTFLDLLNKGSAELCASKIDGISCDSGRVSSFTIKNENIERRYDLFQSGSLERYQDILTLSGGSQIYSSTTFYEDGKKRKMIYERPLGIYNEAMFSRDGTILINSSNTLDGLNNGASSGGAVRRQYGEANLTNNEKLYNKLKPIFERNIKCPPDDKGVAFFSKNEFWEDIAKKCDEKGDPALCAFMAENSYNTFKSRYEWDQEKIDKSYKDGCKAGIPWACGRIAESLEIESDLSFGSNSDFDFPGEKDQLDQLNTSLIIDNYEQAYRGGATLYANQLAHMYRKIGDDSAAIEVLNSECTLKNINVCTALINMYPDAYYGLSDDIKKLMAESWQPSQRDPELQEKIKELEENYEERQERIFKEENMIGMFDFKASMAKELCNHDVIVIDQFEDKSWIEAVETARESMPWLNLSPDLGVVEDDEESIGWYGGTVMGTGTGNSSMWAEVYHAMSGYQTTLKHLKESLVDTEEAPLERYEDMGYVTYKLNEYDQVVSAKFSKTYSGEYLWNLSDLTFSDLQGMSDVEMLDLFHELSHNDESEILE